MLQLKYKSKFGNIEFSGGGSAKGCKIINITGLGLPKKSYKTIEFASENGVTQTSEKDMVRTITITAELLGDKNDCRKISRVLHESGELYITSDAVRRKIKCKTAQPPEFTRLGGCGVGIYTFTVQLQADYPYFTNFYLTEQALFKIKNLVIDEFTLPCVFSERIAKGIINNNGDKRIFPKINILNLSDVSEVSPIEEADIPSNIIYIKNITTDAVIIINHIMKKNELITIDMETRHIYSNLDGDITNQLDDDSILANFYIDIGENEIEFKNTNVKNQNLSATIIFSPEFFSVEV